MKKYLLDTNICIYLIKEHPPRLISKLKSLKNVDLAISSITYFELYFGIEKSEHKEKNSLALERFISPFEILEWGPKEAQIAGKIRAQLQKAGTIIGPFDLLIASQAIVADRTLVTNNTKEFLRIKELEIENWVS